jgi:hypothetical protein
MKTSAFLSALSFVPLVFLPLVEAHGILDQLIIDGRTHKGPTTGQSVSDSPIRQISSASPVKGAMNKAVTCGPDAKPASFDAPANPGSTIEALWTDDSRGHWPHNTGPMEVYLASCGSAACDKFDASKAQWFKINQVGKRTGGGGWVQQDQFDGKAHSFKLPSNLAPGGYLLRHEIIALHLADQPGGAEFYPACAQIKVGGSQSGVPSPNDLVKFPGAYGDNDPGIRVNAFGNDPYTFPGPPIAQLTSGTNGTTGSDDSGTDTDGDDIDDGAGSPSSSPAPSSSPVPSSTGKTKSSAQPSPTVPPPKNGSGNCKPTKKRVVYDDSDDSIPPIPAPAPETLNDTKPRHISRVMARMVKPHNH